MQNAMKLSYSEILIYLQNYFNLIENTPYVKCAVHGALGKIFRTSLNVHRSMFSTLYPLNSQLRLISIAVEPIPRKLDLIRRRNFVFWVIIGLDVTLAGIMSINSRLREAQQTIDINAIITMILK
ncbi:hypothetical protein PUN28_015039 [Cardiocondyla obscurior]|uniref:Uncharacterized protein n=1 Tax=Cardiocondyla obscurior TaxID=286306 RepID=A0AAW2EWT4_9HYME